MQAARAHCSGSLVMAEAIVLALLRSPEASTQAAVAAARAQIQETMRWRETVSTATGQFFLFLAPAAPSPGVPPPGRDRGALGGVARALNALTPRLAIPVALAQAEAYGVPEAETVRAIAEQLVIAGRAGFPLTHPAVQALVALVPSEPRPLLAPLGQPPSAPALEPLFAERLELVEQGLGRLLDKLDKLDKRG